MSWKQRIEEFCRNGMRYCFDETPVEKFNEEEFAGTQDQMGFLDHIISIVEDERKRCFKAGYLAGAQDCHIDAGVAGEFSTEINQITAERRFQEMK